MSSLPISRRTVLRGLGTALGLPVLEAMLPVARSAGPVSKSPARMAFLYVPNGVHMPDWTPAAEGDKFQLPPTLEPLAPFQKKLLVLSGLSLDPAKPHGDGGGLHSRSMSAFLTGRHAAKATGANIKVGISVDQFAAAKVGNQTPFPSLELACEQPEAIDCDDGYSCAYLANLSWKNDTTPAAKEVNPRLLFDRLFANQIEEDAGRSAGLRERCRLSVLDFVMEDACDLSLRLGANDRRKLDEYLNGVREVEKRVAGVSHRRTQGKVTRYDRPSGIPADFQEHVRLLADIIVLAFQADLTRIVTLIFGYEKSSRSYAAIGVPEGHHELSHHGGFPEKHKKLRRINQYHVSQLAYLLAKLESVREGTGNLLDSCMIVYGSSMSDGNSHSNDNLPILLAGKGNGTLKGGRHLRYPKDTPLMNLYLSMLDRVGAQAESFGDSTGRLPGLR